MVGQTIPSNRPGIEQVFLKRVLLSCPRVSRTLYPLTTEFLLSVGEGRILILSKVELGLRILRVY